MSNRTITHEVKLEKSVKIIIGIFAVGVFLNVFSPLLQTTPALAEWKRTDRIIGNGETGSSRFPIHIVCSGCN